MGAVYAFVRVISQLKGAHGVDCVVRPWDRALNESGDEVGGTIEGFDSEVSQSGFHAPGASFGQVAKQATFRFAGLAFDKVLGYVFALIVAKTYGSGDLGLYFFAVGIFEAAYALTELGFDRAEVRLVAAESAKGNRAAISSILRSAIFVTVPVTAVATVPMFFFADEFARVLNRPEVAPFLRLAAITIPASALSNLFLCALEGLGQLQYTVITRMIVEPVVKVLATVFIFFGFTTNRDANDLALAYTIAILVSAPLSYAFYRRVVRLPILGSGLTEYVKDLLHTGIPVCSLALLGKILAYADVFIIFTFVSAEATTHYAIAFRTALLTTMIATAFDAAFKPRIAGSLAIGNHSSASREFRTVARIVFTLCLPACLVFIVMPGRVMAVLGDQFTYSAPVVAIAAVGTIFSYLAGPAGSALIMAGYSRASFRHGLIASVLSVSVALALVPRVGIAGAAIAQMCSMATSNLLNAIWARRKLGVVGIGSGHLRPMAAGIAAVTVALVIGQIAPPNKYAGFLFTAGGLFLTYFGTLIALGLHPEDWRLVQNLWTVFGPGKKRTPTPNVR